MKTMALLMSGALLITGLAATAQPPIPAKPSKADFLKADLFTAISKQKTAAANSLLARGANPNERNWLTLTPLMWAAARGNQEVVDTLLKRGAKINETSTLGTALTLAEVGRHEKMALHLLDKGASTKTARVDKATALMFAAANGHKQVIARILKKGDNPNAADTDGATALTWAARAGQASSVAMLLRAKADVNKADSHGRTPLMYAAMNGHTEVVETLLKHGADVNAKDKKGASALLLAARYSGEPTVIGFLLHGQADVNAKDAAGQTALSLVRDRGYQEAEKLLRKVMPVTTDLPAPRTVSVRYAVEKSLPTLQKGMTTFNKNVACLSCHHAGLGMVTLGRAAQRGFAVDKSVTGTYMEQMAKDGKAFAPVVHQALSNPKLAGLIPMTDIGDFPIGFGFALAGLSANGVPPNPGLTELASLLAEQQEKDGHWSHVLQREPMQESQVTTTALSLEALRTYAPKEKQAALAKRYARAKQWLLSVSAPNVEDKASRLIGLKAVGATPAEIEKAVEDLLAAQRPDGGWAQLPSLASDAYATGMALYALRKGGDCSSCDPVYLRGVEYLLRTQDEDGSWYVNKRTLPANTYFDGGFPHGQSQYSSFAGTCWAVMALLDAAEPEKQDKIARK